MYKKIRYHRILKLIWKSRFAMYTTLSGFLQMNRLHFFPCSYCYISNEVISPSSSAYSLFLSFVYFFFRILQYNYEKDTKNDVAFWDSATGKPVHEL